MRDRPLSPAIEEEQARCGPFRRAIEMLASGAVHVKPLVSRVASLDEYESALADAGRALKVLFRL